MQLVTDSEKSPSVAGANVAEVSAVTESPYSEYRSIRAKDEFLISFIDTLTAAAFKMSEMTDLKKERNFFETRVIEYQTGGAPNWD